MSQTNDDFDTLFRQGTNLLHRGQARPAVPLLEKAHKLDPNHADAALNLSGAYILTKKFKKAVAILEPLSKQVPDNSMVWTNLGAAYLGNPVLARDAEQQRALNAFKKALAIDPAAPNVAYNMGLIYRDRQENERAVHWFKQALKANPNDKDAHSLIQKLSTSEEEE